MIMVLGDYCMDMSNKLLLCNDLLIAKDNEAMVYMSMLGHWSDWTRLRCRTPMYNRSSLSDEEPVKGMGHSSHRHYDRWGNSLHDETLDSDKELEVDK